MSRALLLLFAATSVACPRDDRETGRTVGADVRVLARYIDVPHEPRAVRFIISQQPGGADQSLSAVLRYDPPAIAAMRGPSPSVPAASTFRVPRATAEALFPPEVLRTAAPGPSVALEGVAMDPVWFVNEKKSALIHGRAFVLREHGLVYLALYAM